MARKKQQVKTNKPTLEEVKAQEGRYFLVSYEGYERGAYSIPAPEPRFAGDMPRDLMIVAWQPVIMPDYWLDDGRFVALYETVPGIVVRKSNMPPSNKDQFELPRELEEVLTPYRKQMAMQIATTDLTEPIKNLITVEDKEVGERAKVEDLKYGIKPFLQAAAIYEKRMGNRPQVMKMLQDRIVAIDKMQAFDLRGY